MSPHSLGFQKLPQCTYTTKPTILGGAGDSHPVCWSWPPFPPTGPGEFLATAQGSRSISVQTPAGAGPEALCEGPGEEPKGRGCPPVDPDTSPKGRVRLPSIGKTKCHVSVGLEPPKAGGNRFRLLAISKWLLLPAKGALQQPAAKRQVSGPFSGFQKPAQVQKPELRHRGSSSYKPEPGSSCRQSGYPQSPP